ncbi:membrane protein [Burkholderia lata]|uniref:Membrane protein n=1 Tax=Burkholderia lata (strain ATCC 17760 / DSM 23089 / LMG 22485 / NCIMB 9086 / R18194 / 383) TaxID=482957 RepID=A0A6P3AA07_BURL3|nr:DoxX family protein [Burkholderia lata]VWD40525.1 membrane protein [Burkholderia lata]
MGEAFFERHRDVAILLARVLMMILMLRFGIEKALSVHATVGMMAQYGLPFPSMAAAATLAAECGVAALLVAGSCTRPLAVVMAAYTLGTALVAHRYWTMSGGAVMANMINFYKNLSIVGGLLLLAVTGAGRFSVDGIAATRARTSGRRFDGN